MNKRLIYISMSISWLGCRKGEKRTQVKKGRSGTPEDIPVAFSQGLYFTLKSARMEGVLYTGHILNNSTIYGYSVCI